MTAQRQTNVSMAAWLADPHNFWAALVVCHLAEQELQARSDGSFYTPEEISSFMAERTIESHLLDQVNDAHDTDYDSIDEVFGRE